MNWQHLTYFLTTAELQNFTRAAEQLYLTPSALSKAIRNLESELGFPLFEKQGRRVILTEYGKIFSEYVNKAADDVTNGIEAVQRKMGLHTGRIKMAGIFTMCSDFLPTRIQEFMKDYPDVTYSIDYFITSKILEKVLAGEADLGFCGDYELGDIQYQNICRHLIQVEDLVIIVSQNHLLAQVNQVSFASLANESFIIYRNVNSGISRIFWEMCRAAGINPRISFEVPDDHSIVGLVANGLGIAIVPDYPSLRRDDVRILRVKEELAKRNQYMVWKKGHYMTPVAKAFHQFIIDTCPACGL